jgi:outer membrane usher protein
MGMKFANADAASQCRRTPVGAMLLGGILACSAAAADVGNSASAASGTSAAPAAKALPLDDVGLDGYDLSYRYDKASPQLTVFNSKIAGKADSLSTTFAGSGNPQTPVLTRLESTWSRTLGDSNLGLRVGDVVSSPGSWGSAVRIGGVQVGSGGTKSELSTRSDLIATPRLGASGVAVLPATADLLTSNWRAPTTTTAVAPAQPFIATSLPNASGAGIVNMTVTDVLGRSQSIAQPLYPQISLLDRGRLAYSVEMGRAREDFGLASNQYGPWFASTTVRYGMTRQLTVEGHAAQLDGDGSVMGLDLANRFGQWGVVSATVASSRDHQEGGWLARVGFEHSGPAISLAWRTILQSPGFREIGTPYDIEPLRQRNLAGVAVKMGGLGNLSLTGATQTYVDNFRGEVLALSHSLPLGPLGLLSTAAGYSPLQNNSSAVFVSFSHPFRRADAGSAAASAARAPLDQGLLPILLQSVSTRHE